MHRLKILHFLTIALFLTFGHAPLLADNEPNDICTEAEVISELNNVTTATTHTESGWAHEDYDEWDIYRFDIGQDGLLNIDFTADKYSYSIYIERTCGAEDIDIDTLDTYNKYPPSFSVTQGETVFIRIKRRYETWMSYNINIDFSIPATDNIRNFTTRYQDNLQGNVKVIGNTVLTSIDGFTLANSQVRLQYVDIDGTNNTTFNSSSATITTTEGGVDVSNARIKWAGLYWQGYLHTDDSDRGIDSQYSISNNQNTAHSQIQNIINTHTISLTTSTGTAIDISPDQLNWHIQYDQPNYVAYKYGAFVDLTPTLQGQLASGTYTVANIPTREGNTNSGNYTDFLGNYGAWALVIVYDNNTSALEKTRNVSVFDGYLVLNSTTTLTNIPVSGFKTPSNAPDGVDSTLSVFAAEGDKFITGDFLQLIGQDGTNYTLSSSDGSNNFFNSSIEGVNTRNPSIANNMGIDIHTQNVGTSSGSDKPIKTNNTSATIRIGTNGDHFVPSMAVFATELFTPELCYDYDVRIGDYIKVNSEDREIDTNRWGDVPLTLTLLIRSELSDFPIDNTMLNVVFSPSTLDYIPSSSQVSPPDVNTYLPIGDIDSALGKVGIGRGATSTTGGTIGALESTYIKQDFRFTENTFNGSFNINVSGNIQFDPNALPIPYSLSTDAPSNSPNYISRCSTNPTYDPIWANFNIERSDSTASQTDEIRYPLYTQIAGKDFNVSIVSYTNTGASGEYDVELETNATVELELINASFFDNNASAGYDSTCEEPAAVGDGAFINFSASDGQLRSRVAVKIPQDIPNFDNDIALQSAAFRLWVLSTREANGTKSIVLHDCTLDGNCFEELYKDRIESYDTAASCKTACDSSYTAQGCYTCLRQYFATPICSRDNFSIRPESYRISISDNNESNTTNGIQLTNNSSTQTSPRQSLSAGYKYAIDINSTLYESSRNAQGYYNDIFEAQSNLAILGDKTNNNMLAALEFKDSSLCTDNTHRSFKLAFNDGKTLENSYISHNNAGDYNFWMIDSNWTNVDQSSYPYKARFGSCQEGDTRAICSDCDNANPSSSSRVDGKLGCTINSNLQNNGDAKDNNYVEIPLHFEPYAYNISNITMLLPNDNNYVYINDDLENIASRNMSVRFEGKLAAIGRYDGNLSNYTAGCAAKDVKFDINTSMTQEGIEVSSHNIKTEENVPQTVYFKKNYVSSDGTSHALDNNESNLSTPIVIRASEFKDENNGTANVKVYYNFKRYKDAPVNPIQVLFIAKEANSTDATSATHKQLNYIPKQTVSIQTPIDFFYGRLITSEPEYIVQRSQSSTVANLYPEVYCDFVGTYCSDTHKLPTPSLRDPDTWMINDMHSSPEDGIIDSITDPKGNLIINPNLNVDIVSGGLATQINISIPSSVLRTYTTTLKVDTATSPWFDEPKIDTTFLGGGGWAGPGKTGLVLESNASYDEYNKRTEW